MSSSADYMPLGRPGGPYRPESRLPPARLLGLLGLGVVVAWFVLRSSSPTVVPSDPDAEARMRAAQAYPAGRVVHALEDRGEGGDAVLRDNPKALYALRQALREAVSEAKAVGGGADPLELLARKLLLRAGVAAAGVPVSASAADNASVPTPVLGGPGTAAPNGGLLAKFPTAGMWPARFTRGLGIRSQYASVGALEPYRGGDLEAPGELRRAAAARSYNGELILTYGNEAGTAWFANLAFSLRAAGIEHFLVIVMDDRHCAELMKPPWRISCAWSSWDFGRAPHSGTGCKNKFELRRLWYSRHHYMARVIGELGLNVAVLDGDISVQRDFYPAFKSPPLAGHNLIYTLDHAPTCGDLNVGFAYCQNCRPKGRAQWVLEEGLRREGYYCGGNASEFNGDKARFWAASDAAGASTGPHRWVEWTTARDQKLYSDVVGGSCCGKPQHRLLFPGTFKVADQYAFMRQWGAHANCMSMSAAKDGASSLQTWWHDLLTTGDPAAGYTAGGPVETVAVATGALASGWHGTGHGELAGWSGHWHRTPPAVAHFVGGGPAGGKVEIMQGLGWWRYEADVVAHAIAEATNRSAGYALPPSFFWPATRRGILALAGPAATVAAPTSTAFLSAFAARRRWLLRLAVLLQRTAADPRAECDAPWVVTDAQTGHRGQGYLGRWATPGWPWPFHGGVGVVPAQCSYVDGSTQPAEVKADCCSPIFGKVEGVRCLETAHAAIVESFLSTPAARPTDAAELPLSELMVDGAIDARAVKRVRSQYPQRVLWVRPPLPLPPLRGLTPRDTDAMGRFANGECVAPLLAGQ